MRVLGIDPGYDRLGVAILEHGHGREVFVHSHCIETDKSAILAERIFSAAYKLNAILTEYQPDAVALETLFYNKNAKTVIGVAQMRGVALYLAQQAGCQVLEYGPQAVKVAVTGYGASDKTAVIMMVKQLVPEAPPKALDDEYDAIAVALTALAHER